MFTRTQPPSDFKALMREQVQIHKRIDDRLAQLRGTVEKLNRAHAAPPPPAARGWHVPPSTVTKPAYFDPYSWPKLNVDPPRFDGANVIRWITRIQQYYNHSFTPLDDRLYLIQFLLDDAAAEWFVFWEENNTGKSWDDFLVDIKLKFDTNLSEDYVGQLARFQKFSRPALPSRRLHRDELTAPPPPLAMEEPTLEEVVEQRTEDATPPPPPATEGPSETVVEKVEEKAAAVEIINESIVREVTAPTPPACEQPDTTPAKEEPQAEKKEQETNPEEKKEEEFSNVLFISPLCTDNSNLQNIFPTLFEPGLLEVPAGYTLSLAYAIADGDHIPPDDCKFTRVKKRTALEIDGVDNDAGKRKTSSETGGPTNNTTNKKTKIKVVDKNVEEELRHALLLLSHSLDSPNVAEKCLFKLEPTNVGNYLLLYDDFAKTRKWKSALWLQLHFPHRHLEDKVLLIGGRVDTDPMHPRPRQEQPNPGPTLPPTQQDDQQQPIQTLRPRREVSKPAKFRDFIAI